MLHRFTETDRTDQIFIYNGLLRLRYTSEYYYNYTFLDNVTYSIYRIDYMLRDSKVPTA